MSTSAPTRVAVVGSALTELRPAWSDRQHVDLIAEVVSGALKGTGLRLDDVDFIFDSGSDVLDGRSISNCGFLGAMGAHLKEESRIEEDGLWAALYGVTKIQSGAADVGVILAYSKPSETRTDRGSTVDPFYATQCEPFLTRPVGLGHAAVAGLQAQSYRRRFEVEENAYARVAEHAWRNAGANPSVSLEGEPPTLADIESSASVARPLRELELSRPVDGAVAIVIASARIAHKVTPSPVWITGMGTAMDQHAFPSREHASLPACRVAAEAAYRRADLSSPGAVSLVECSAGSAAGELMVLEALGLAEDGRGLDLYEGDGVAVNPSGGALPADPVMATGLVRLSEAALQLTGRAEYGPAEASAAIVHGAGGVGMQNHCVFVLEV